MLAFLKIMLNGEVNRMKVIGIQNNITGCYIPYIKNDDHVNHVLRSDMSWSKIFVEDNYGRYYAIILSNVVRIINDQSVSIGSLLVEHVDRIENANMLFTPEKDMIIDDYRIIDNGSIHSLAPKDSEDPGYHIDNPAFEFYYIDDPDKPKQFDGSYRVKYENFVVRY